MKAVAEKATCRHCSYVQERPTEIPGEDLERCPRCDAYDWYPEPITFGGQLAVLTISFREDVKGEDARRLGRTWAADLSKEPTVFDVHVKTHGTVPA